MENNDWGFQPIGVKVLLEVDKLERFAGKEGIIIIPDTTYDKFQVAQIKGKVIAMGGDAFYDVEGVVPKVGDKVYFAKYAGVQISMENKDKSIREKREARIVNDKDIIAILDPEVENIES